MKNIIFIIVLFSIKGICQNDHKTDIFIGIKPLWSHISFDSSFADNPNYKDYDGYNHYFGTTQVPPYIFNGYIINNLINNSAFCNGSLMEKIELKTGKLEWQATYDLTNSPKREFNSFTWVNKKNEVECLNFMENSDSTWIFPTWGKSKLVRRTYDFNNGLLKNNVITDNIRFNLGGTYLYPANNENKITTYSYLDCSAQDENFWTLHMQIDSNFKILKSDTLLNKRTLNYFDAFAYLRFNGSFDTLVSFKRTNSIKPWNINSLNNLKIELYNSKIELIKSIDITSQVASARNNSLAAPLHGRFNLVTSNNESAIEITQFIVYSFDYDGNLKEKIVLDSLSPPVTSYIVPNKLRSQDGLLIVRNVFNNDLSSYIEFLQTDGKGNIVNRKVVNLDDNLFMSSYNIFELEDGNFLLNCSYRSRTAKYSYSNLNGRTIVCLLNKDDIIKKPTAIVESNKTKKLVLSNKQNSELIISHEEENNFEIHFHNLSGQRVHLENISSNKIEQMFSIAKLTAGIYFAKIVYKNSSRVYTEKFIKY